jgi:hypothetical protein
MKIDIQDMFDVLSEMLKRERAKKQMTLGKLIKTLEGFDPNSPVIGLYSPHSYRGYYSDLAFEELVGGSRPAWELLEECKSILGKTFEGYKGGEFVMDENTPVWIAYYGSTGEKLISIHEDGTCQAVSDDY